MARKSHSFGQLLAYMTIPEQPGPSITHNLQSPGNDIAGIHREFLDNTRYLPPRKNGNVLYHEILSFSDQDRTSVTPTILEDLTRKYLELRSPNALAFAQAHFDTECPHMHIMISANNLASSKRLRLSRVEFAGVKRSLEQYQRQRYPFLEHSVVYERGKPTSKRQRAPHHERRGESERSRRLAKASGLREPSQKEQVRALVAEQLTIANSGKALFLRLKNLGLLLYKRGKHVAVQDLAGGCGAVGRRYRLKTLGLEHVFQSFLERWRKPQRLTAIEAQDLEREQQLWLERGYRDEIFDVLALRSVERSPLERERLEQIRVLRTAQKRERDREPPDIFL